MNLFDPRMPADFWNRISPEPNSGCWIWVGMRTVAEYGVFSQGVGNREYAHRAALRTARGLADGLVVDHLCRNTACCNPAHLEAVTHATNVQRGMRGSMRTHCKHGHEYTPENTWRHTNGNRYCRACKVATNNAAYHARKRNVA